MINTSSVWTPLWDEHPTKTDTAVRWLTLKNGHLSLSRHSPGGTPVQVRHPSKMTLLEEGPYCDLLQGGRGHLSNVNTPLQ